VLVYFWRLWVEMLLAAAGQGKGSPAEIGEKRKLFWYLVIGTIPGGIAGYLFEHAAEEQFRKPLVIGTAMIVVALLMWAGERFSRREESLGQVNFLDSIVVGAAQALAVIPGVSRSGVTMTAGLFRSMTRETAARFSFLLSTPLIAGAALKKGLEIRHEGLPPEMKLPFALGIVVSGLVGYVVIAWLIRYLERRTFAVFVVYRLALGLVVLAWGFRS
jgi:undecaprenyl-diphosphatase